LRAIQEVAMSAGWERWARGAGVVFAVLAAAGFIVAGESPKVSDSAEDVVDYLTSNRGQVITGAVLFATSLVFFLWFAAAVANYLRESGEGRVGATVLAAGAAFAAIQLIVSAVFATLANTVARGGDAAVTKALFDLDLGLDAIAGLMAGLFVLAAAVGLRRTASIPTWLAWAGVVVAALEFLRATTWAGRGFWSPSGGYGMLAVACGLAWILVTSVVLVRRAPGPVPVPRPESAI
jgi:hypothetical protein